MAEEKDGFDVVVVGWRKGAMTNDAMTPRDTVIALMQGTVPERKDEIASLWQKYAPDVVLVADAKDRDTLLSFYDFPAEHWKHLRTTNPIESTFSTVRHRTIRSKGCLSNKTALAMVFKLVEAAQKSWRRLDGHNQLPKLVLGVTFNDGVEVIAKPADRQPKTAAA